MQVDDTTRIVRGEHVLSRQAAGEVVLLSTVTDEYYGLNEVGSRVWELLEEGATFATLVAVLAGEFEVDRDVLTADLQALVVDLLDHGLVVTDGP